MGVLRSPLRGILKGPLRGVFGAAAAGNPYPDPLLPALQLWLDASDVTKFTLGSRNQVNAWVSSDTNARSFTPVSASWSNLRIQAPNWKRPCVNIAQNANSGFSCTAFDISTLFGTNGTGLTNHTIYAVYRCDDPRTSFQNIVYAYTSGATGSYVRLAQSANNIRFLSLSAATHLGGSNATFVGSNTNEQAENIAVFRRSSNTLQAFLNGAQFGSDVSSTATAITTTSAQVFVGCSSAFGGGSAMQLCELRWYAGAHTTADRILVEDHLAFKWIKEIA